MLSQHSFQNQRMVYTGENGDCSRSKMTSTVLGMADVTCGTEGCHWRVTSDQDNHNSKLTWLSNSLYNSKFCKIANFTKKCIFTKKMYFTTIMQKCAQNHPGGPRSQITVPSPYFTPVLAAPSRRLNLCISQKGTHLNFTREEKEARRWGSLLVCGWQNASPTNCRTEGTSRLVDLNQCLFKKLIGQEE